MGRLSDCGCQSCQQNSGLADLAAVPRAVKNARKAAIARRENADTAAYMEYNLLRKEMKDFKAAHPGMFKKKKRANNIKKETRVIECPPGFAHCTATVMERPNGTVQILTTQKKAKRSVSSKYKSSGAYKKAKTAAGNRALQATLRKKSKADDPFKAVKSKGLKRVSASTVNKVLNDRLKQLDKDAKLLEATQSKEEKERYANYWKQIRKDLNAAKALKTAAAKEKRVAKLQAELAEMALRA
jgi:hypothetical protein